MYGRTRKKFPANDETALLIVSTWFTVGLRSLQKAEAMLRNGSRVAEKPPYKINPAVKRYSGTVLREYRRARPAAVRCTALCAEMLGMIGLRCA